MIIEPTGLPGAGKTTSESCVISCCKQKGFRVLVRSELKNRIKKEALLRKPGNQFSLRIHSNLLSNWKELIGADIGGRIFCEVLNKKKRMALIWLAEDIRLSTYYIKNYLPTSLAPSIYFPNEGLVHHSASARVWTEGRFPDLSEKMLLKFSSKNFLILYFKISVDEAVERLLKRGLPRNWPLSINSRSKIKEVLLRFDEAIEGTVQKFQANGVKVQTIDASLDLREVREAVGTCITHGNLAVLK